MQQRTMRYACRGLVASLAVGGALVAAGPARADSSTIAGAQTVVPGTQYYGNLSSVPPDNYGEHSSYWLLPETAGDAITINWQAQNEETQLNVFASGTNDYDVGQTNPLQQASLNSNDEDALSFQATSDGTLPLQFKSESSATGPYSFSVEITHDMVVSLGALPTALSGTASIALATPDGTPLGSNITGALQISGAGVAWTTIGQAAASGGTAVAAYTVPATLYGKAVKFRAVGSGAGYETETSASQSITLPATPPPAPAPTPTPPAAGGGTGTTSSGFTSCANTQFSPGPSITYIRELGLSCTSATSLIAGARFTGDPHWALHGAGHWGLQGGRGVGRYGMRVSGYDCSVLKSLHGLRGGRAETIGMNVSCAAGARRFGFVWDSWIPGFAGTAHHVHGRIWGHVR